MRVEILRYKTTARPDSECPECIRKSCVQEIIELSRDDEDPDADDGCEVIVHYPVS